MAEYISREVLINLRMTTAQLRLCKEGLDRWIDGEASYPDDLVDLAWKLRAILVEVE